ncbi:MAG: hypothetical protein HQK49_07825 [Oligoflexia bacterium]|nr:hypothetical protein [Oligoflexia bacterium]
MKLLKIIAIATAIFVFITPIVFAMDFKNRIDMEHALIWQGKNQFQITNNASGTRIDIKDNGGEPFLVHRLTYYRTLKGPHHLRLLIAPLEIKSDGILDRDVLFQNQLFQKSEFVSFTYKFNSYRVSYLYYKRMNDLWSWYVGGTLKVRDAKISIKGKNKNEEKNDLGLVPLLSFGIDCNPSFAKQMELSLDADALAAPQGRAEDISLKISYIASEHIRIYIGYRMLEGGADNKNVYTFALFHYLIAGVRASF